MEKKPTSGGQVDDGSSVGKAADVYGNPAVDPSENVKALSEAANKRQDDLREAQDKLAHSKMECLKENIILRAEHANKISDLLENHAKEMRISEAARLDSIRQVDVTAVRTEATRALEAIQTLAATSARDAETLRNSVITSAGNLSTQTADTFKQVTERLAAVEKSGWEGVGKQRLADPQMAELIADLKMMRGTKSEGVSASMGVLVSGAIIIAAIVGVLTFALSRGTQTIYLPAAPSPQVNSR